ncbi:MAG: hypothetical protein CBD76_04105 [Pelagibacteraceae bacterium TMED216]|nr:MAG: hypothetical protein CBD76_04105 [Pelagibacteraceae bacterium TMED216]|tara:strand:+ start:414 stop:1439 length:1026 start_codon:yes stop_codon:yes gene_type:complete
MILNNSIHKKHFELWLKTSIFLIFLMILVGGLTRLTDSGLSITEWELFSGVLPPFGDQKWNEYFLLYKKTTQFTILNSNMTIDEFKVIYYWEYFHRFLGRLIGLIYIFPLIYFTFRKIINKNYLLNFYLIFFLILFQGIIGWYMVVSGLSNEVTVSHYRLSIHLITAFFIMGLIYWNYLNIILDKNKSLIIFLKNKLFFFLFILILLQIIFGAFVSGLDAGKIYNTWPLMNNNFYPDDLLFNSWKQILDFNDRSLVQFYHRLLAYVVFLSSIIYGFFLFKKNRFLFIKYYSIFLIILFIQALIGVFTLISGVNIYFASAHQLVGVILFLSFIRVVYGYNTR